MFHFDSEQFRVKVGLAEMLKGGVIMDVTNADQAKIAEDSGASAVMALERVPADIRKEGGVARMASIAKIEQIMRSVSIPVMAKARIGHFMEARILEALCVDYIDESEVLTPADEEHHIAKQDFKVPFVCGARNLGEALRRVAEGAAMIRTKGEAGSGNIVEAVRHIRTIVNEMKKLTVLDAKGEPTQVGFALRHKGHPVGITDKFLPFAHAFRRAGDSDRALELTAEALPQAEDRLVHADLVHLAGSIRIQQDGISDVVLVRESEVEGLDPERVAKLLTLSREMGACQQQQPR